MAEETTTLEKIVESNFKLSENRLEKLRKAGRTSYEKGAVIHGQSFEDHRNNGHTAGKSSYEKKAGIHKLSNEEKSIVGKIGGIKSVISRGMVPYSGEKKEIALMLLDEKSYIIMLRESGYFDYYGGWFDLTKKVNDTYGNNRKYRNLQVRYHRWTKDFRKTNFEVVF